MANKIMERINGDLTDPLNLNIVIYTCTYVLSIISAVSGIIPHIGTEGFQINAFWKAFTDCIVPTTATLVLGNVIQNFVAVGEYKIKRFALSLWTMISAIAYMLLYPPLKECGVPYFTGGVLVISIGVVVLGMSSIVQVEKEKQEDSKSLSG